MHSWPLEFPVGSQESQALQAPQFFCGDDPAKVREGLRLGTPKQAQDLGQQTRQSQSPQLAISINAA